ncbi:MAG TPA: tetratricopeptide repeat protein [Gemmatimonadaceae bacterium]|nr:tetratricopeptide repeat protein [Gemmatimonadaceae bacterium]
MRTVRLAMVAGVLVTSGCAPAISGSAENVARLERAHSADPGSEDVQRSLGIAYFKAQRYADARTALQAASASAPDDGVAALFLGLTAEAQEDLPAARQAYETYLKVGRTRRVRTEIQNRLAALKLREIQVEAKQALARESEIASIKGPPNTIAVMPFRFTGADTSLKPLERGFAELVTTDLSRVSALTVVDRMRLQALLDEIALQQQNGVAEGTGVRAGKLLQVGRMVGGSIEQSGEELQASAIVTDVATSQLENPTTDKQSLDQLFTLEKNIVFGVINDLGVVPTTAERNAIEQRPTKSLAAFLAYSRGLELEDQGRFEDASRFFDNAARLDPNFGSAVQKSQEAKAASAGTQVTASTVESSLRGTAEGNAVASATANTTTLGGATTVADGLNPSAAAGATSGGGSTSTQPQKDPSSGTQGDNPTTKSAKVTITIHQPGKP